MLSVFALVIAFFAVIGGLVISLLGLENDEEYSIIGGIGLIVVGIFFLILNIRSIFLDLNPKQTNNEIYICVHCDEIIENDNIKYCPNCGISVETEKCSCNNCVEQETTISCFCDNCIEEEPTTSCTCSNCIEEETTLDCEYNKCNRRK